MIVLYVFMIHIILILCPIKKQNAAASHLQILQRDHNHLITITTHCTDSERCLSTIYQFRTIIKVLLGFFFDINNIN